MLAREAVTAVLSEEDDLYANVHEVVLVSLQEVAALALPGMTPEIERELADCMSRSYADRDREAHRILQAFKRNEIPYPEGLQDVDVRCRREGWRATRNIAADKLPGLGESQRNALEDACFGVNWEREKR